ncbi:MAG TPA: HAMP domain-containing sensor histidine kinase [Candidatus Limnocylindria bacterium]|nr:HAMP domain-containing sensor histidine kinase [Candidatus Limnocylindria bacterium]
MAAGASNPLLLVVPLVAVLDEPMTPGELAARVSGDGLELAPERVTAVLERAVDLGLARVGEYEHGDARYVATSLGQRAAAALLAADPELQIGLGELERLRTDLLATVGHELRTPLTAIRTSVGLLLDPGLEPSEDQRQQLLGTIGRSADRMQRLVTDLLDLARLRAGRIEMQVETFDARALVEEAVAAIGPMAAARDQTIRVELPDEPIQVTGDRRRLEQALLNLAANAQKFSPSGAEVVIRLAADGGAVRWTVTDHGPGISDEERARLFERFFVGTSDRQAAGGGAGIGLPTALAVAQAHGGTIEVESALGEGSKFHLVLPDR